MLQDGGEEADQRDQEPDREEFENSSRTTGTVVEYGGFLSGSRHRTRHRTGEHLHRSRQDSRWLTHFDKEADRDGFVGTEDDAVLGALDAVLGVVKEAHVFGVVRDPDLRGLLAGTLAIC